MAAFNEALRRAKTVHGMFGGDSNIGKTAIDYHFLGIHEALTKLWVSAVKNKNDNETRRRLANVLFGTLLTADALGIRDVDGALDLRLEEMEQEVTCYK